MGWDKYVVWPSLKNTGATTFKGRLISREGEATKKVFISQVKGK